MVPSMAFRGGQFACGAGAGLFVAYVIGAPETPWFAVALFCVGLAATVLALLRPDVEGDGTDASGNRTVT